MKKFTSCLLAATILFCCSSCGDSSEPSAIKSDLQFLCSEECYGRLPGSEGNHTARDYIATQFESAGLLPLAGLESYLHAYTQTVFDASAQSQTLTAIYPDGTETEFHSGVDFYPYLYIDGEFSGSLIIDPASQNEQFKVSVETGIFAGKEVPFVKTDMMTARIMTEWEPLAFHCGDEIFTELSSATTIALSGNPETREASVDNVIGVLPGKNRTEAMIVSAHFDHIGGYDKAYYPGAFDNASGVSALLQIVREMDGKQPPMDIVFIAFNGEDMGGLGSAAFAAMELPYEHLNAINIDVVGAPDMGTLALVGDRQLGQSLVDTWAEGEVTTAVYLEEQANSDHVALNAGGIPAVTVSSHIGFDAIAQMTHYTTDTADGLDPAQIAATAQAIIHYLMKQESIQILSPKIETAVSEKTGPAWDEAYALAEAAIDELKPAADEVVVVEAGTATYIVRNVTHFVSPAALLTSRPDVSLPMQLGDFVLNESIPINSVGRVVITADGDTLGIDAIITANEEGMLPGRVYPLPDRYYKRNYLLKYENALGKRLYLDVQGEREFSAEDTAAQFDRTEVVPLEGGMLYLGYQQYEGLEYFRGAFYTHPDMPVYFQLGKADLLSDISAEEVTDLVVQSIAELKKLPPLF